MNFSSALILLTDGYKLTRKSWLSKHRNIMAKYPDESSLMTGPYLYVANNIDGIRYPWTPSQNDLFANDWEDVSAIEGIT